MDVEMEITKEMVTNEKVINQLKKQFHYLEVEIIESVAYECNYNVQSATEHLLEISQDILPTVTNDLVDLHFSENQDQSPVNTSSAVVFKTPLNPARAEIMQETYIVEEPSSLEETKNDEAVSSHSLNPETPAAGDKCAVEEMDGLEKNEISFIEFPQCSALKSRGFEEMDDSKRNETISFLDFPQLPSLLDSTEDNRGSNMLQDTYIVGEGKSSDVSFLDFPKQESGVFETPPKLDFAQQLRRNSKEFSTGAKPKPKEVIKEDSNVERIIINIKRGVKVLILLRGLPGSGKSYLAKNIFKRSLGNYNEKNFIISADDYFMKNGSYVYDKNKIQEAHRWCQKRALNMFTCGISPVIIDNTNTQIWEMKPYCVWAVDNSYVIEILEPRTEWRFNERELARRNKHNVPRARIQQMSDRYEPGITVEDLFEKFNLCYRKKLPPQPRNYPKIPTRTPPSADEILSTNSASFMDSWTLLEPTQVGSNQTKETSTMTGDKNPEMSVISVRDDFISAPLLPYKWPHDGFFDKGTMTEDVQANVEIENLSKLFQKIPMEYLKDVYEKCQHDIDWTLDILLADNKEIIENYNPPPPKEIPKEIKSEVTVEETPPIDPPKKIKQGISEEAASLKKSLETSFVINHNHYSDHLKKIKKMDVSGTSSAIAYSSSAETVILDYDDDSSYEAIDFSDDNSDSQEEMIELKVGDGLIEQLNTAFGDPNFDKPDGIQPVIEVPVSLGRQLHALWLESLFKQIDMYNILMEQMVKEDEEFAKKLQEQEFVSTNAEETPDLKQIMKDQYDLSKQKRAVDEWKNLTPDDLAYKLTVQKLCMNFLECDRETLVEILAAHNNCYKDTVESLINSGLKQESEVDSTEPVNESLLMDMKASHQSATVNDDTNGKSASQLRAEAWDFQKKRQELLEKAKCYYSKGMYQVALFYSELASKQTHMYEKYNNMAAETFLTNHFNQNNQYTTIDLHYLFVPEAMEALDRFLDNNIMLINENKKAYEDLLVITGRGKNSRNGVPRIKPAVQKRLRERGIKMENVNSGLIRARINKNSKMTTDL